MAYMGVVIGCVRGCRSRLFREKSAAEGPTRVARILVAGARRKESEMQAVRESVATAILAACVLASATAVQAAGRVALVVGNSTYAHVEQLPNPENDAVDMAAALGRLGFDVTTELDADRVALTEALRTFTRQSAGADVSLVFYAGHGIEMDGVNYVVPVDARLERDVDVRYETVTLDDLLMSTAGASLRLVVLDACRNNPLARSMQRTAATRTVSRGSFGDLNEDLLGDETLVAYAAAAGTTAADGRGRNSPYTAALLTYLEQPLELSALFRRVRAQVLEATDGEQRPHEYGSLLTEHYLSGASGAGSLTVADGLSATVRAQQENLFWESIVNSTNAADFEEYLRQFPTGIYRGLATNQLGVLRAGAGDAPANRPAVDRPERREPLARAGPRVPGGPRNHAAQHHSDAQRPARRHPQLLPLRARYRARPHAALPTRTRHSREEDAASRARLPQRYRVGARPRADQPHDEGRRTRLPPVGSPLRHRGAHPRASGPGSVRCPFRTAPVRPALR